jgi:hypothetical protein
MTRLVSAALGRHRPAPSTDARQGVVATAWRMARRLAAVAAAGLTVFHARLLWDRLTAGEMLEPLVALRWTAAILLVVALVALRRAGVPLLHGRRALAVWVLVALLHWSAGPPLQDGSAAPEGSSAILLVLPAGAVALAGLGLTLAILAARRAALPSVSCLCTVGPRGAARLSDGWRRGGLSRAPPHRFI